MQRQGRPVLVTFDAGDDAGERVLYTAPKWGCTLQLPLSWGLWRVDLHQIKSGSLELSPDVLAQLAAASPQKIKLYFVNARHTFVCDITPQDIGKQLKDGKAVMKLYATALEHDDTGDTSDVLCLDREGRLLNVEPTKASAALDDVAWGQLAVASHPLGASNSILHMREPSLNTGAPMSKFEHEAQLAMQAVAAEDSTEFSRLMEQDMDSGSAPLLGLFFSRGHTCEHPALEICVHVSLFQAHPAVVDKIILWQQAAGLLPMSKLQAAWQLSTLSSNSIMRMLLPFAQALLLLSAWTFAYLHLPLVQQYADDTLAALHSKLPPDWQDQGSTLWHWVADRTPSYLYNHVRAQSAVFLHSAVYGTQPSGIWGPPPSGTSSGI